MKINRLLPTLLLLASATLAQAGDLVVKQSANSVQATMDKFEQIVKSKGLNVFARIDHAANAEKVGMKIADAQVLIFGNPKMGTLIMQQDLAAGLDLPLRVLVYADADGKTWISYHNPQGLKTDYKLEGNKALNKAEGALGKLTSAAAK